MPLIGATLTSASIAADNKTVTWVGTNLGENQYAVCAARCTKDNGASYTTLTISTWGSLTGTATSAASLTGGSYTLEITTSDSEVLTLSSAFSIASTDATRSFWFGRRGFRF